MTLNLILVLRMVSQSTEVSKSFSKVLQMLDVLRLSLKKKKKLLTFLTDALTLHYIATDRKKKKKNSLNIAAPTVSKSSIIRVKLLQIFPCSSMN